MGVAFLPSLFWLLVALPACQSSELDNARDVWQSSGRTPAEYGAAAVTILLELDQSGKPVTPGAAASALGSPSSFELMGYAFDKQGNTEGAIPRLQIRYESRRVVVYFAASGSVDSVLYKAGDERSGRSHLAWPRTFAEGETPTAAGLFKDPSSRASLLDAARAYAEAGTTEGFWYKKLNPYDDVRAEYKGPCRVKIVVADAVTPRLAWVTFLAKGKHTLHWDTWWLRDDGGEWKQIGEDEARSQLLDANAGNDARTMNP